tara:strand:+ start:1827 stop:3497 length:1671 start_codon:yes stop_codon:yes gene_type:complete
MAELNIYKPESQVYQRGVAQDASPGAIDVSGPKMAEGAIWDQVGKGVQAITKEFIRRHEQAVNLRANEILDEQNLHNSDVVFALNDLSTMASDELSPAKMVEHFKDVESGLVVDGKKLTPYKVPDDLDPDVEKLIKNKVEIKNNDLYAKIIEKSKDELNNRQSYFTEVQAKNYIKSIHTTVNSDAYDPELGTWTDKAKKGLDQKRWYQHQAIENAVNYGVIKDWQGQALKRKVEETQLSAMFTRDYLHDPDKAVERAISGHYKYPDDVGGGILESSHWEGQVKWDRYGKSKEAKAKKNRHAKAVLLNQATSSKESGALFLEEWGIRDDKQKLYTVNEKKLTEMINDPKSMLFGTDIEEADLLGLLRSASKNVRWSGSKMGDTEFANLYSSYEKFVTDQVFGTDGRTAEDPFMEWEGKFPTDIISADQHSKFLRLFQLKKDGQNIMSSINTDLNIEELQEKRKNLKKYKKYGTETGLGIVGALERKIDETIATIDHSGADAVVERTPIEEGNTEAIAEKLKENNLPNDKNNTGTVTSRAENEFWQNLGIDKDNLKKN